MKKKVLIAVLIAAGGLVSVVAFTQIAVSRKGPGSLHPPKQLVVAEEPPLRLLATGSYLTSPYTCILIVPPEGLDDGFVLNGPSQGFPMPIIKPRLEFIPLPMAVK